MNSVHRLPIVSTPTYLLPETVRRSTVEDTSYSTFSAITVIPFPCPCVLP